MAKIPPSVGIRECYLPDDGVQFFKGEWIVTPRFVVKQVVPVARHREQFDELQQEVEAIEAGPSFWGAFRK